MNFTTGLSPVVRALIASILAPSAGTWSAKCVSFQQGSILPSQDLQLANPTLAVPPALEIMNGFSPTTEVAPYQTDPSLPLA